MVAHIFRRFLLTHQPSHDPIPPHLNHGFNGVSQIETHRVENFVHPLLVPEGLFESTIRSPSRNLQKFHKTVNGTLSSSQQHHVTMSWMKYICFTQYTQGIMREGTEHNAMGTE